MNQVVTDPNAGNIRSSVLPARAAQPKILFGLVGLMVGSSFFVVQEPAPCDLLFVLLCLIAPFYRDFRVSFDLNPVLTLSVTAFVLGNIVSFWFASASPSVALETGKSLLYLAVTIYLVLYWYVITTLIRSYGLPMIAVIKGAFIFAACAATVIGLMVQMHFLSPESLGIRNSGERILGSFKDPNVYGPFLSAAVVWITSDVITRARLRLLDMVLLGFLALGIVGALSRGAFVNVIGSLFVLVVLQMMISLRARWLKRLFVMVSLVSLLGIPSAGYYLNSGEGREALFEQRLGLQKYDDTRFAVQRETLGLIPQYPLGVGPGQSQQILPQNPHNVYLMVTFENGLLGGIGFFFFLLTCTWICFSGVLRRGPYASLYACCLAILAGTLVNSLVIDSLHWRHLFLFLAIPVGLDRFERAQARLARKQGNLGEMVAAARVQQRRTRRLTPVPDHARST